ncbi:hypothetical protein NUH16_001806 [Penicillium rubens]|nr:hypothetical protein NUH16_001806 [Penicillium rubens]
MALDTYLVVFHHFDTQSLRKLELKYIGVISTLSFIPAFVFLFIRGREKGPIYDMVLNSPQLDDPPNNILLCARMSSS